MVSNAVDMTRWLSMQLSHGVGRDGELVVEEDTLEDTHTPQNTIPELNSEKVYQKAYGAPESYVFHTYGLGWRQGYYRGKDYDYSNGGISELGFYRCRVIREIRVIL